MAPKKKQLQIFTVILNMHSAKRLLIIQKHTFMLSTNVEFQTLVCLLVHVQVCKINAKTCMHIRKQHGVPITSTCTVVQRRFMPSSYSPSCFYWRLCFKEKRCTFMATVQHTLQTFADFTLLLTSPLQASDCGYTMFHHVS